MKPQTLSCFVTKLKLIDFYPHYESSSFIQLTNFAGRRANLDDPRFFFPVKLAFNHRKLHGFPCTGSPILCQCGKSILHMSNHDIFMITITIKSYKTIKKPYKITIKPAFYPHHSWRRQSRTVDVAFDAPRAPSGPQAQQFYWGYSHPTMTHVDLPDVFLLDICGIMWMFPMILGGVPKIIRQ